MDREEHHYLFPFRILSTHPRYGISRFSSVVFNSPSPLPSLMLQVGFALLSWWMQTHAKVFTAAVKSQKWESPKHSTPLTWLSYSLRCSLPQCLSRHRLSAWETPLLSLLKEWLDFSRLLHPAYQNPQGRALTMKRKITQRGSLCTSLPV